LEILEILDDWGWNWYSMDLRKRLMTELIVKKIR
jgi:hypothetical protein